MNDISIKGIGSVIQRLREESSYTLMQLGRGICSPGEVAKIEGNQLDPGHFLLDRLLGRLGKTANKLEYLLPSDVYVLYELQYKIQTHICHGAFQEAEELLKEYEKKKQAESVLHRQFIEKERAQIAWIKGEKIDVVTELLEQAIRQTILEESIGSLSTALSADELKLLLFRWEISRGTPDARASDEVAALLKMIETHITDPEEKVSVYPYAVLLLAGELQEKGLYERLLYLSETALELLRTEGRLLYLPEMIELHTGVLDYLKIDPERSERLKRQRKTVLQLEEKYDLHFEKYRLFTHTDREFNLDYEVIQRNRNAGGISQEELCRDICAQETLSRIETGRSRPSGKNVVRLLRRMGRKGERVDPVITAEDYETIELRRKIEQGIHKFQVDQVQEMIAELEKRVDKDVIENQQYIAGIKASRSLSQEKCSQEEALRQYNEILRLTVDYQTYDDVFRYRLTSIETNTINHIAIEYSTHQQKDIAIKLYKNVLENYEESRVDKIFHIRELSLQMGNLASCLEETGAFEKAISLSESRIELSMEVGKGNELGRSLTTIGCVLEQKKDEECLDYFKQALDMLDLMKMEARYQWVLEGVKNSELLKSLNVEWDVYSRSPRGPMSKN